jgi:AcrR family transcriptional regulator
MAENGTTWRPTARQAKVLEAASLAGVGRTITAICEEAGVPARTFYNWLRDDPDFKTAWEDSWRVSLKRHLPGVIAAQIDRAINGDTKAARLLADVAGLIKQKLEHSGEVTQRVIGIEVVKPSDD